MGRISDTYGASLKAFRKMPDGHAAVAEADGKVQLGDILMAMNGHDVEEMLFIDIVKMVGKSEWPLTLQFRRPLPKNSNRKKVDRLSSFASAAEAFVFNSQNSRDSGALFDGVVLVLFMLNCTRHI